MGEQNLKKNNTNIPSVSVQSLLLTLGLAYSDLIKEGKPVTTMPSVMLWGAPGVGKSAGVRQIANLVTEKTGKKTVVTDVRLLLFNPIDLRGIPTANEDKTLAVWLKPKIFQMDDSADVVNFLFLDEITAAPQTVQAAAYQIVLDRMVGEHKLPDNCIVIAAGNRVSDKSVANKMPKALANRMMHFEVTTDIRTWKEWAKKEGINEDLIKYIGSRPAALMKFEESGENVAFPTPRTWKMVSDVLDATRGNISRAFPMIWGLIGEKEASLFKEWYLKKESIVYIDDIFAGKCKIIPEGKKELCDLIADMTVHARAYADDLDGIRNSLLYAKAMPAEYRNLLVSQYMTMERPIQRIARQVIIESDFKY